MYLEAKQIKIIKTEQSKIWVFIDCFKIYCHEQQMMWNTSASSRGTTVVSPAFHHVSIAASPTPMHLLLLLGKVEGWGQQGRPIIFYYLEILTMGKEWVKAVETARHKDRYGWEQVRGLSDCRIEGTVRWKCHSNARMTNSFKNQGSMCFLACHMKGRYKKIFLVSYWIVY